MFTFITISLLLCCVKHIECFPSVELLHEYMTESELAYIFNTDEKNSVLEYEIVYLPVFKVREAIGENEEENSIPYKFSSFGRNIQLNLVQNKHLLPRTLETYIWESAEIPVLMKTFPNHCYYLHNDNNYIAAISVCEKDVMNGIVLLENSTLEIHPVPKRLHSRLMMRETLLEDSFNNITEKYPHIVRRASLNSKDNFSATIKLPEKYSSRLKINTKRIGTLTVEVALFFDEVGYKIFAPYFDYNNEKIRDMLLAYLNGVQALYHHPSLGTSMDITLVRLDIMKTQPSEMPHFDGERSKLLDSFCTYQQQLNVKDDSDPRHWDMALYVSGLDFFAYEKGKKSGVTMGLATVGGVCLSKYNCIIAELGTTNVYGKPYPSAGFTSVYILAHEMGHNFGMHHDSSGNSCPKEGYVMSPSRGTNGETQWSSCSADVMSNLGWAKCLTDSPKKHTKELDHTRFLNTPGQFYTAKKQCEILLRDEDAVVLPSQKVDQICQNLHCKTPHRSGFYYAGPALDGTVCGQKKYCFGGQCITKALPKPLPVIPGGWSFWKEGTCQSACIQKSKGHQIKERHCTNPTPVNTDKGCEGSSYQVGLCNDQTICRNDRISAVAYASEKCEEFSEVVPDLDPDGIGLQAPYEEGRLWMGCAIFCKRIDSNSFITPRVELNDLGISPYFPDGTWCHNDSTANYYCLHHHCLPENFQLTKDSLYLNNIGDDIDILQNARPDGEVIPELQLYFSLGPDGKPLQQYLKPTDTTSSIEEWETKDYVDLPTDKDLNSEITLQDEQNTYLDFIN